MPSGVLGRDQWRLACLPCARALAQIPETKFQELKDLILSMTSTTSNRSGMPAIYGVVAAAEVERLKPLSELSDISAKGEVRGGGWVPRGWAPKCQRARAPARVSCEAAGCARNLRACPHGTGAVACVCQLLCRHARVQDLAGCAGGVG